MVLVPWRCYREFSSFSQQMSELFDRFFGAETVVGIREGLGRDDIEVIEGPESVRLTMCVGGFRGGELRVEVAGRILVVEGSKGGFRRGDAALMRGETFIRRIELHGDFDIDKAEARLSGGRLMIELPRARAAAGPIRITVD